jgi:hypothetical protein
MKSLHRTKNFHRKLSQKAKVHAKIVYHVKNIRLSVTKIAENSPFRHLWYIFSKKIE